ncbi:MAG: hypothetical protein SF162_02080 [bacterium]|nr:hypothetical protein [bacterium]
MTSDPLQDVQRYRALVLEYEALDEQIDQFIIQRGGKQEHEMTTDDLTAYREMARRRDDLLNEIRQLETELHLNDEDQP